MTDTETVDQEQQASEHFDRTLLAVNTLVAESGLDPNAAIEIYMRSMWGMAMFVEQDPLIARAKLTAYFTQFSEQLLEQLQSEAFKASLILAN